MAGIRWPAGAGARHSRVWHKGHSSEPRTNWRPGSSSIGSLLGYIAALSLPRDSKIKLRTADVVPDHGSQTKSVFQFNLSSTRKNVLLVEDESMVAMMVEKFWRSSDSSVVGPYGTLDDAMRAATETRLDAAILDINLEGQLSIRSLIC